jgi:FHS family glucose/mannose:H+ symporter-like MFS transporter
MVRRSILTIACLSTATFGMVTTAIGATLPSLMSQFGMDKPAAGALLSLQSFCVLAGTLVFGPLADRRGYQGMLIVAFATIVIGLETIAFASSIWWLRLGVVLIGFSGGLINGGANALVSDVSAETRAADLTFVGAFFGVGAVGVPLVLATLSGSFSRTSLIAAIGLVAALPLVFTAAAAFPPAKQPHEFPVRAARALLLDPALLLMGLILFLQSGMESTVGGWTPSLFAEEMSIPPGQAPIYLALFWCGVLLTRLLLGVLLRTVAAMRVLAVSFGVALVSAAFLVATRSVVAAAIAVFVLGCGFAAVFPIMYGFVGERYAHLSGTALGLVIAMALVGGMIMPYVTGLVASAHGLRVAFLLIPTSLVAFAILLTALWRILGRGTIEQRREGGRRSA